jgi:hypothetical protein
MYIHSDISYNISGSSKAPSSPARGKKSMKKARIQVNEPTEDDEDECTFVPGV